MKNNFQIDSIQESDFVEVANLVNSAYRGDSSRQGWTTEADYLDGQRTDSQSLKKELSSGHKTVLCLREVGQKEIMGTVFLEKVITEKGIGCYLGMLTINPMIQNQGYGRWLINAAEKFAKNWGAQFITLGVLHLRHELMAWYERRGYQRTNETQDFPYGKDEFGIPKTKGLHFIMFEKKV